MTAEITADELKLKAQQMCELLNTGVEAYDALTQVGLDEDDASGESMGDWALQLDDADNNQIDLLFWPSINDTHSIHYVLERTGKRGRQTPWTLTELIRRTEDVTW